MSLKEIRIRYKEACNCGYVGTFVDYAIKIGVDIKALEQEKGQQK